MIGHQGTRLQVFRLLFILAGAYNLAFGLWTVIWPQGFFHLFDLEPINHPAVWRCLGMVVGVYGAGYLWAAARPEQAKPIIALGLAGKVLGPIGWIGVVASGQWPASTGLLIVFNDLIWWPGFIAFLFRRKS